MTKLKQMPSTDGKSDWMIGDLGEDAAVHMFQHYDPRDGDHGAR